MKTTFKEVCQSSKFAENLAAYFAENEISFQSDIVESQAKENNYAMTDWQSEWHDCSANAKLGLE